VAFGAKGLQVRVLGPSAPNARQDVVDLLRRPDLALGAARAAQRLLGQHQLA
jgi:hypothetical protein